jgi:hypothetical protein
MSILRVSNSKTELEVLVDNWLTDAKRRGAVLYAVNRGNKSLYLSFEGKGELRYSVRIDFVARDVRVQITGPEWNFVERKAFLLNAHNLRALANRMCLVGEGQAVVPVYLLAQLSILCQAYRRLIEDFKREYHVDASTNTVVEIESELRRYLTSEEPKRTDRPTL